MRHLDGSGFSVSVAGKRERSPEYPCVSRFRQRRLLSFLRRQKLFDTYDALTGESGARIDLYHLADLVKAGRWDEAIEHLSRFLPPDPALGVDGRVLLHFLRVHKAIHAIVSGAPESRAVSAALRMSFTRNFILNHAITKLRVVLWSLLSSSGFRDSLDFGRVRDKAASTVVSLAYQIPELKEHVKEASGPAEPHNVLPIGFGFRPRRHVKRGPIPGSVLVRHYLRKRRMLASSISSHCEGLSSESLIKAKEWMVDLVDSSLEAGKRHQGHPLPYVCTPTVHKDLLVLNAKEWAVYLIDQRLEAWPDLSQGYDYPFRCVNKDGFPVAQVSQTIPGTLVGPGKSFTISSVTKAEVPSFFQVLHPLKGPARNYGISPVTNAGGLPSQAMSAILTPPYDQFLISTEKNAGVLSSEAMSAILASPSKCIKTNTDALPSETMSAIWASPYENSLISTMANPGTHKHLSQEHCYNENAYQDFSPRKNPRMERTTVGQGFNPKRQRTTLASLIEGEAEDHLTPCS